MLLRKHLLIMQILTESQYRKILSDFGKPVFRCENPFGKPLKRLKVLSQSCPANWNPPGAETFEAISENQIRRTHAASWSLLVLF